MDNPLAPLLGSGSVVVIIEILKRLKIVPWITQDTGTLNRILAIVAAAITAVGIQWTFTDGTLVVSGLTLPALFQLVTALIQQLVLQEGFYHLAAKPPAHPPAEPPAAA